jgi:autotransporter-associated beta strand protein
MDDYTISGNIVTNFASPQTARGTIQLAGSATVTLTGNNTYGGGTVINNGALRIGNGGGSGSVGFGPVTLNSGNPLVINRTGSLSIPGAITGGAGVTLINSGTVTLSSTGNAYTGDTTVSNGTLVATSVGGTVNLEGGTLVVQGIGSAAVLTVPGNLNLDSGTVVASLNTAQVQSNTFYAVTGVINSGTPVTLKLLNAGPLPVAGSKFTIFSTPVTNVTVFSPGMTVQNDLAVDGSVTLLTVAPAPQLSVSLSGNTLNLTWPATWTGGVHLQGQTNALTKGLSGNWVTIPGSDLSNVFTTQRSTNAVSVFFRLIMP